MIEQAEGRRNHPQGSPRRADAPAPPPARRRPPPAEVEGRPAIPYVYAIGTVEPRFPSLAAEKEFAQTTGRAEGTAGLTDREATHLCYQTGRTATWCVSCFVMTIQGLETYILRPRDPADSICWSKPSVLLLAPRTWT